MCTFEYNIYAWCCCYRASGSYLVSLLSQCVTVEKCSTHRRRNRGGTRGTCPPPPPPPPPHVRIYPLVLPLQTVWYGDLFDLFQTILHIAGTRAVMAQWSLNDFVTKKHKTIKELFWLEYKYDLRSDLRATDFNTFTRGACPQTPLACACLHTHHHQFPPSISSTFRHLLFWKHFRGVFKFTTLLLSLPTMTLGCLHFLCSKTLLWEACHSVARAQDFCCPVVTSRQTNHLSTLP